MRSVYEGTVLLDTIEEGKYRARDADGEPFGTFTNRRAAMDRFSARKAPAEVWTVTVDG